MAWLSLLALFSLDSSRCFLGVYSLKSTVNQIFNHPQEQHVLLCFIQWLSSYLPSGPLPPYTVMSWFGLVFFLKIAHERKTCATCLPEEGFSRRISSSIHSPGRDMTAILLQGRIPHRVYILHFLFPLICWLTLRLLPCLGCWEQCWNKKWMRM